MATRPAQKVNYRGARVNGDLAYKDTWRERERAEREAQREEHERRERELEQVRQARREAEARVRRKQATGVRLREKQKVSLAAVAGFLALAAMVTLMLVYYTELNAISIDTVNKRKELAALREENVSLMTRYEKAFDLAAVKQAAEAAGMAKPSASQVYYVDLSEPDNVVIYRREEANVLSRVFTFMGQNMSAVVEYFK